MESGVFGFITRYSKKEQVILLIIIAVAFPFLYMSFDLPKMIINKAIGGEDFPVEVLGIEFEQVPYLMLLSCIFLSLVLINGGFKYFINVYRGAMGERMLRRLRYQLIERVMRFPLPHFRNVSQGEVVAIVTTETEPLGGFIGEAFSLPAFQGGTLLTILAFMFVQDWLLGLAAIALYPVQMYAIPKLQRRVNLLAKERVATARKISERVSEVVSGVHEIHANDTSQFELADFSQRLGKIFGIRLDIYRKKFFIKFLNNFLAQVTPFFFYSIGGYFVIQGDLSFGALVAVLAAYKDLASPWKELLTYYQRMEDSRIKYQQLVERFQPPNMLEEDMLLPRESVETELTGSLVANNVSLEEEEGTKVVAGASFSFDVDDHVALVGAAGSGKNEVAKLMSRQVFPTGGSIAVNGVNLNEVPEAVTGRQFGYIDPEVYISAGTIRDNLYYVLKNYPRGEAAEIDPDARRDEGESAASGNSVLDVNADWIDYGALGVDGPEGLRGKAIEALQVVGLEQDIFDLGLRRVVDPERNPKLAEGILKARKTLHERLDDPSIADLVQVFDESKYNVNASVAENILFGTPVDDQFDVENLGENEYVQAALEKVGLSTTFLEMGVNIASVMVELFKDLPPGHEFFERFGFIDADELSDFQRIINLAGNRGVEGLEGEDRERIADLPFKLIVARHRLDLIDDAMQEKLLETRRVFAETLPDEVRDSIAFFDIEKYNAAASVLDNALFGKVAADKADGQARVVELVTRTIDDLGLRPEVLEIGLDYDVGIGGKRLTQAQRQKLGIARGLLKNPKMMIVNDSTAALPKPEQESVLDAVKKAREGAGLVWVTDDPDSVAAFEVVMAADSGRINEQKREGAAPAAAPAAVPEEAGSELGQDVEILAGIPFFAGLDRSKLKLLAFTSDRQTLEDGEILFKQGEPGEMAYVVVEGGFDILVDTDDGPLKVASNSAGDVTGELALLCDAPRTATLKAVGQTIVLRIAKDVFLKLLEDNAEIGANLTRIVAGRLEYTMRSVGVGPAPLYDNVTGLANRNLFIDRIESAITADSRDGKISALVLFDFAEAIETVDTGDGLSQDDVVMGIADRLKGNLRKADSLSRLGDTSFGIVAKGVGDGGGVDLLMKRVADALAEPLVIGEARIDLAAGYSSDTYPLDENTVEKTGDIL